MDARVQAVQTVIRFKDFDTSHRFLKSSPEIAPESPGEVLASVSAKRRSSMEGATEFKGAKSGNTLPKKNNNDKKNRSRELHACNLSTPEAETGEPRVQV